MTTVGSGKYTYRLEEDWAKLPPGEEFGTVSAVATDSQDRVYAFQDRVYAFQRKDPPVLVFDREGNFLSSWGNGNFVNPHGILYRGRHYLPHRPGRLGTHEVHVGRQTTTDHRQPWRIF